MADSDVEKLKERIKELEEENRKWMRLAGTDRLTELPNSLMLYQVMLPRILSKGINEPISLSCILLCPDGLGEINQQHGRIVGDQLIKQIADSLKEQKEPDEQLFHCDGANFAILTSGGSEGHAKRRASLVKSQFLKTTFTAGESKFTDVTCSAGVAEIAGKIEKAKIAETIEELYHDLCNRLYEAKKRGGNFVQGSPRI